MIKETHLDGEKFLALATSVQPPECYMLAESLAPGVQSAGIIPLFSYNPICYVCICLSLWAYTGSKVMGAGAD